MDLPYPLPNDPLSGPIERLARERDWAHVYGRLDRAPEFPWDEFRALGEAHLLGLSVPRRQGGPGLPLPRTAAALFHLAYRGGSVFAKLALQPEFCSVLGDHGSPEQRRSWFAPQLRGHRLVGNQITEPSAGSDVGAVGARARRTRDGFELTGEKSEAAFAMDAGAALVYARLKGDAGPGLSVFLVPQDAPGVRRTLAPPDLGERWQRRGRVVYERAPLSRESLIGQAGRALDYVWPELIRERVLLGAIYLGVARASLDSTVAYAGHRHAFGRPLSSNQAVSFALAEDCARIHAAWLLIQDTLSGLAEGEPAGGRSALAKWMAGEAALTALDHAVQFHGGQGYSAALPHEQRWRDVRSARIAHGTSEILRRVAARSLWPRDTSRANGRARAAK